MPALVPALLLIHIALAIGLFVPSLLLPFALRSQATDRDESPLLRGLLWLRAHGSAAIAVGLAVSGLSLAVAIGPEVFGKPWLMLALAVYAANLVVAFVIQRPGLRRLLGVGVPAGAVEQATWERRARRQRYVSYGMTAGVGLIGFLMSTKPELW